MSDENKFEIEPVHEMVSGHTVKVQVRLDEDSEDQEIMSSLDDSCRQWATTQKIDMSLRMLVGKLLISVRERRIYEQEQWGTFEKFLAYVDERYDLKRSSAWNAIETVEAFPALTVKQAEKIGPSRLLVAARAVNHAPERSKDDLAERLTKRLLAKKIPLDDLKAELRSEKLLPARKRRRGTTISFQVSVKVAEKWYEYIEKRKQGDVFTEMFEAVLRDRKPVQRAKVA